MFSHWTFGVRIATGKAFAVLVLLVICAAGYYSVHRLIDNDQLVSHTHQVRRDLADLLLQLKDAEGSQRAYLLTGLDEFRGPFQAAEAQVKATFDHLKGLTADNKNQQERLSKLSPLIKADLDALQRVIDQRKKGETVKSVTEAKEKMDAIRSLIGDMDREEQDLLKTRDAAADATAANAKLILLAGGIGGSILVALYGWLMVQWMTTQIGSAVQLMRSSSAELQASATQQTTGMREQAASMSEVATTIRELVATARQIAESAQRVAGIAADTARGARGGDQSLLNAQQAADHIRSQVDVIVTHMLELGRKSQQIGGILEVINELAEQTNILAINASIEAAGAGEAGRRFGVVADEIRKLADRVAGSTKDIRSLIEEIRSAVHTTVMATESGSKAVDAGARQFRDVSAAFQQIVRLVDTSTEAAREIELSTKQQTTAVEQVNEAIASVAQASKESEVSSTQILQTATELTALSRDLARVIQPETKV